MDHTEQTAETGDRKVDRSLGKLLVDQGDHQGSPKEARYDESIGQQVKNEQFMLQRRLCLAQRNSEVSHRVRQFAGIDHGQRCDGR